jgi:hypothetical protein
MNFGELMIVLCEYYREPAKVDGKQNIRVKTLGEWIRVNLNRKDYSEIFEKIITNFIPTSINTFPLIPHVKNILCMNNEDLAIEMTNKIIEAAQKFGHTEGVSARKFLGEDIWDAVKKNGGWYNTIEQMNHGDINIFRAQIRDFITATKNNSSKIKLEPEKITNKQNNRISNPERIGDINALVSAKK